MTEPVAARPEIWRLARHTVIYGIGTVVNRLAGVLLLPVYTRALSASELGVLWVVLAASGVLTTILGLGMTSAVFRFYYRAETPRDRDRVISTAFFLITAASVVGLTLAWVFREPLAALLTGNREDARHLPIVFLGVLLDAALTIPFAYLRAREKSVLFSVSSLLRFIASLVLTYLFVVELQLGVYGVFLGNTAASAVSYVVLLPTVARCIGAGYGRDDARRLLAYGTPIMLATIGTFLLDSGDVWLLRWLRGLEEVSAYGTVYRIARALRVVIVQPFMLAWPAAMMPLEHRIGAGRFYARVLTYAVAITAFAALGLTIFRRELILLLATEEFLHAAWVMPWIAFSFVFLIAYFVLNTGVSLANRTGYMSIALLIAVSVNVALNLVFIPPYGMRGAAVTTFVSYAVMAAAVYAFGQRTRPVDYEWRRIGLVAASSLLFTLAGLLAERFGGPIGLVLRCGVWLAFPASLAAIGFLTPDERSWLTARWRELRAKGRARR